MMAHIGNTIEDKVKQVITQYSRVEIIRHYGNNVTIKVANSDRI